MYYFYETRASETSTSNELYLAPVSQLGQYNGTEQATVYLTRADDSLFV